MPNIQYFLGANSPQGFYSLYDQLICLEDASSVFILKGGAGCGKSTLMRRVAQKAEERGLPVEYILCSGDPDSLDAVVLPTLKAALVDGTAPHVVEPKYPGVVEQYVNLGACYNRSALIPLRENLMNCMKGYKNCYQRAYHCLNAAAEINADARSILLTDDLYTRLEKRARGILSREVPRRKGALPGQICQRFLSALSHNGRVTLYDTAAVQCPRIYELSDRYGLAHAMLVFLLTEITTAGYDAVACPSPMAPDRLEHLLVPELGLAFVTSSPEQPFRGKAHRRLRLDAMTDSDLLRRSRPRLNFARKVSETLVSEAVESLAQAKAMHDELEAIYNPHVNFQQVEHMADEVCAQLFG